MFLFFDHSRVFGACRYTVATQMIVRAAVLPSVSRCASALSSDQDTARGPRRKCLAKRYGGRIPHHNSCVTVILGHCYEKVVRLGLPNIACTTLTKCYLKCYNSTVFQALSFGTYEVAFSKIWTPTKMYSSHYMLISL